MKKVALMSIRPEYAAKILDGEKRIELRRQRPRLDAGDLVVVYATSPLSQIAGAFLVERVLALGVETMWRRYRGVLGIERESYGDYFADRELAYGIVVERAWSARPMPLKNLRQRFDGFVPPQSYMYWPDRWTLPSWVRDANRV